MERKTIAPGSFNMTNHRTEQQTDEEADKGDGQEER
jgi:hypothetical protein